MFGPAVLDERTLELSVHGAPTHLERKSLEVLMYLLHHAGEVVTKEEFAENVWPGRILTESVLTVCMSQIRHVLKDEDRAVIRTIHGFGYRLVAEVRVEASTTPAPPKFAFKPGDHPPLRPQWCLVERLGTGGHGEAWLARHEKTQDERVFKFALDAEALASLKREITLYRLLHGALGERAAVVRIFEWNVEEPPCFLETEYVEGRDLRAWADARGGLAGVPLEVRLDLVAQIADALAAAHRVGVLHKDLKPGNVLIAERAGGPPQIKLCDFGSGGVLDPVHLERLGITRLGFTSSAAAGAETGATSLYVAPEVIAGQPFTISADIYALGAMLYQLIVGDLRKALAPGWELNVTDVMLREDVAAAADGDPARRLADAAQLATRLRSLEPRRLARAAEAVARERAERASRALQALRRARLFASVVLVLAVAAITGSVMAYRARNDAIEARATTQAINDFLMEDVLGVDPALEKPKDASYESLLSRAAGQVDTRFKDQPEAAASIHWLLGRRFQEVGRIDLARIEYEKASAFLENLPGDSGLPALLALDRLIPIYFDRGRDQEVEAISKNLRANWVARYGEDNVSSLLLRARLARLLAYSGELVAADREFRAVLSDVHKAKPPHNHLRSTLGDWLGVMLTTDTSSLTTDAQIRDATEAVIKGLYAGYLVEIAEEWQAGERSYQDILPTIEQIFGGSSDITIFSRLGFGLALAALGRHERAEEEVAHAERMLDSLLAPGHWMRAAPALVKARILLEQRRPDEAMEELERARTLCTSGECPVRIVQDARYALAESYDQQGNSEQALIEYREALKGYEQFRGPRHYGSLKRRISLADALLRAGKVDEASLILAELTSSGLDALPPTHLSMAEFKRVQGALWVQRHQWTLAVSALKDAVEILERHLGAAHWRTNRARMELQKTAAGSNETGQVRALINR